MDMYQHLGIRRYLNAHDTYTVYGGSRMASNTLQAMASIAESFVDFEELQRAAGRRIAELTHNEAAYVTNGAAGGLQLAAAVCLSRGDAYRFMRLPRLTGQSGKIVVMRCQHNAYDKAIEAAGATLVQIGDADETLPTELEGVLREGVDGVFYFASTLYARAALPLAQVAELAHRYQTPVVVDAAAQLPPRENLWKFTAEGADLVLFSGGKTLCGPQDSGMILGKRELIEDCIRFGAPAHGVCRSAKASREAVAGLVTALENYCALDEGAEYKRLEALNLRMAERIARCGVGETQIVEIGPVGQAYPRLFITLPAGLHATAVVGAMRDKGIYIGHEGERRLYISPLQLTLEEADTVAEALAACLKEA
jgi:L-seryl-tRNA(Ser) seleniumtransferase